MKFKAVFLDRDGVLNEYLPGAYVRNPSEFQLIGGVAQAIRKLNDAQVPVIVISNQQGVGKGLMSHDDLLIVESHLKQILHKEAGAHLDRCYYCTDLKNSGSKRRKPEPGMLLEAAQDFGLNLAETVFIGDTSSDIAAGHNASVGAKILVLSGANKKYAEGQMNPAPDHVFDNLGSAVDWVLEQE